MSHYKAQIMGQEPPNRVFFLNISQMGLILYGVASTRFQHCFLSKLQEEQYTFTFQSIFFIRFAAYYMASSRLSPAAFMVALIQTQSLGCQTSSSMQKVTIVFWARRAEARRTIMVKRLLFFIRLQLKYHNKKQILDSGRAHQKNHFLLCLVMVYINKFQKLSVMFIYYFRDIEFLILIIFQNHLCYMSNPPVQIKNKTKTVSTFLKKTYGLLNDEENQNFVKWAASGIGFIIANEESFSRNVLPKYFKHSNYSSFVRQLNMYNFHKIRENSAESYFHHECFDRNNRSALADIQRKPQKKKKKNQESQEQIDLKKQNLTLKANKSFRTKKEAFVGLSINMILDNNSQAKVSSEKNTQNIFEEQALMSIRNVGMPMDSDNLSVQIEQERGERQIVRTREMINASHNNIFPVSIQNVQSSILSIFY